MGELTRKFDWSKTPLGRPEHWPQSLRTSVSILLNSQFPMFVWWGKDLTTIYNNSYSVIAGDKHPSLLGQSGREGWAEIWEDLSPLVEKVFAGASTWSEDLKLLINRRGSVEETYFTFSYSPILDESGAVGGLFCAVVETTEKVVSKRYLEESRADLAFAIEAAELATWDFNPLSNRFTADARYTEWFGLSAEQVTDNSLSLNIIAEEDRERVLEALAQAQSRLSNGRYEIEYTIRPEGKPERILRAKGKAWFNNQGIAYRITGTLQDITRQELNRKRIEESEAELQRRVEERTRELATAISELRRSNSQLEEFAHAASHDLKEPIRKIHFFTDRLKNQLSDKLAPEDQKMFGRVERASQRMNSLIDDLLLYSHVSQKPHQKETVDLNEKLKNVLEDLELDIEEKDAVIIATNLPVVQGYRRQLQQLFHNLLTNALKYNKPNVAPEITISATMVKGNQAGLIADKNYYLILVTDNGIGFEQEQAEKIFQMFQRLHGRNEYEGTGVGLSIARKVVENHAGKITAQSQPGKGASFSLYLPAE